MINGQPEKKTVECWNAIKKQFTESNGLLEQIEKGRVISVQLGSEPETCQELHEIQQALKCIRSLKQSTIPKWQVSLLLSAEPRIQHMLQAMPEKSLMLHTLHAKLFTWMSKAWYDPEYQPDPRVSIEDDIAERMGTLSLDLRFFGLNMGSFETLLQKMHVFAEKWKGRSDIPRPVAWHFIEVPTMDWDAEWYHRNGNRKQVENLKDQLLNIINESLIN